MASTGGAAGGRFIEYITLHVLLGRAEGLEGDAGALAVLVCGKGEEGYASTPAARLSVGPVPFFSYNQTIWTRYYRSAHFGHRETKFFFEEVQLWLQVVFDAVLSSGG